jgi:hypothetical protein
MKTALILSVIAFICLAVLFCPPAIEHLTDSPKWQVIVITPNKPCAPIVNIFISTDTNGWKSEFPGSVVTFKRVSK